MSRSERTAALEEKKRRLDALRARRTGRTLGSNVTSAVIASKTGNLDDYIDGLLNSPPPIVAPPDAGPVISTDDAGAGAGVGVGVSVGVGGGGAGVAAGDQVIVAGDNEGSSISTHDKFRLVEPEAAGPKVETFAMSTQTEEDHFPVQKNESDDDDDANKDDDDEDEHKNNDEEEDKENKENVSVASSFLPEPKLLSPDQVNKEVANKQFSTFFTSASKKVERLLGANILSDLLVDDSTYSKPSDNSNTDDNDKANAAQERKKHSLITAHISFSFPRWTQGRDITSIDFSPHHRGELMLASYHSPTHNTRTNTTSTSTSPTKQSNQSHTQSTAVPLLTPNPTPSSTLRPRSNIEMTRADGLCVLWNLTMPSRPEHIFTCGSPVLQARFHPTEPTLVIGACHSGQVVVWDTRSGRLPVQRSSLNVFNGGGTGAKGTVTGHVHPVVGMELLDGGSALVTACSDGKVNYWSPSNLRDPAETIMIPGSNISSIAVAPESQSLLLGDESGAVHCIVSSASASNRSSARRVRRLDDTTTTTDTTTDTTTKEQKDNAPDGGSSRHYGMVTGLSTKSSSMLQRKGSGGANVGVSLARGFVTGANGLALSCGVDWTTKLWAPAYTDKPLMNLLSHSYDYMCDVQWSPVHPSIFATASSNGTLGLWNLATSLDEPITGPDGVSVEDGAGGDAPSSSHALNKIKWSQDGRRIVAASYDTLHVFGMAEEVWKPNADDETRMMNNLKGRGLLCEG